MSDDDNMILSVQVGWEYDDVGFEAEEPTVTDVFAASGVREFQTLLAVSDELNGFVSIASNGRLFSEVR